MLKDEIYLQMAYINSLKSTCCSYKVGAIIVKSDTIISSGFNGVDGNGCTCMQVAKNSGWLDVDNHVTPTKRPIHSKWSIENELHAEARAFKMANDNNIDVTNATIYTTLEPCVNCANLIVQNGISNVVFGEYYDMNKSSIIDFLNEFGITATYIPKESLLVDIKTRYNYGV